MRRTRTLPQWHGWLFIAPALLFVTVFVLIPLGQLAAMSLTDRSLLGGGKLIGFTNYWRIWNDASFWRALEFTAKYTLVLTPILMGLGFAVALLTVKNTLLKRLTRTIVFLPVVIGLSSSSLLWFWLLDEQVGPLNKLLVDLGLACGLPERVAALLRREHALHVAGQLPALARSADLLDRVPALA